LINLVKISLTTIEKARRALSYVEGNLRSPHNRDFVTAAEDYRTYAFVSSSVCNCATSALSDDEAIARGESPSFPELSRLEPHLDKPLEALMAIYQRDASKNKTEKARNQ
jgi:hypothetical protein